MTHSPNSLLSVRSLTDWFIHCLFNNTHLNFIVLCVDSNVAKTSAKTRVHASVRNCAAGGRARTLSLPMPEPLCWKSGQCWTREYLLVFPCGGSAAQNEKDQQPHGKGTGVTGYDFW